MPHRKKKRVERIYGAFGRVHDRNTKKYNCLCRKNIPQKSDFSELFEAKWRKNRKNSFLKNRTFPNFLAQNGASNFLDTFSKVPQKLGKTPNLVKKLLFLCPKNSVKKKC